MNGKRNCRRGLVFAALILLLAAAQLALADVYIPDPGLQSAIRSQLGLGPTDPITNQEMLSLKSLVAETSDLTGLQSAINLHDLQVVTPQPSSSSQPMLDLSPLGNLANLSSLGVVSSDTLQGTSALSGSTCLTSLALSVKGLQQTDLTAVSSISNLTDLNIGDGSFTSFAPLSQLTHLRWLALGNDGLTDISSLPTIPSVQSLLLNAPHLKNMQGLSNWQQLTYLAIGGGSIDDLSGLEGLINLKVLSIIDCDLNNTSPIEYLPSLAGLSLHDDNIACLAPLSGLHNLYSVDLSDNDLRDISSLLETKIAASLDLTGNPLSGDSVNKVIPEILANNPGLSIFGVVPEAGTFLIFGCCFLLICYHRALISKTREAYCGCSGWGNIQVVIGIGIVISVHTCVIASTWVGNNRDEQPSWSDANNWSGHRVPTSTDDAIVDSSGMSYPFVFSSVCAAKGFYNYCYYKGIELEPGSGLSLGTDGFALYGGGSYIDANSTLISEGPAVVTNASLICQGNFQAYGGISLAITTGSTGSISLCDAGNMNYTNNSLSYIGHDGNGIFNQSGSGSVYFEGLYIGYNPGSYGKYVLGGTGMLWCPSGIVVGPNQSNGRFEWHPSGRVYYTYWILVNPNGTLAFGLGGSLKNLVTGQDFDLKMGSVDLSQGNLEISDGSTLTHDANYALTMRSLSVANGTYDLVDSAKLTTTAGLIVGSSSPGTFIWETANGKVVLNGQTMTINSNGTLDMLFGFDANALTTGSIFQGGGCLNISAGTLKIDNGATATQNATQTFSLGMLCVNDGTYYLDGNGTLSTSRGISVGTDGNSGLFEWHSGTISVGGNAMTVDANGTLAMDTNFSVNDLFSGSLFSGGGSLAISSGTLQVQNGATATVASGSAVPRVGNVYLTNGGLSFSSGSSGISVQNALILDGNSSLQSSDANNTLIVQPALGALAHSSIQIQSKDSNALSGLGGVTVKCQFDPNDANSVIIELEVAGRAYDPNLVDPNTGVDNNFSKSNFVINHLVVGNADSDANVGKHGVTLRLVNSCPNQSEDPNDDKAVYVGTLEMLRGSTIDPNGFHLYYLTSAGYPNKKKEFFLGDANLDGKVDGVDFLAWQSHYSTTIHSRTWSDADFNGDRTVDGVDFLIWQSHYPSNSLLMQSPKALSASAGSFSPSRQSIDLNGDGVISVDEAAKAFDNLPVGQ